MVSGYDGAVMVSGIWHYRCPTIVTISPVDTTYTGTHLGFYGVLNTAGSTQDVCTIPMEVNLNVSAASNSNFIMGAWC